MHPPASISRYPPQGASDDVLEALCVGVAVNHELRQGFGGIQCDIATPVSRQPFQPLLQASQVLRGGNDQTGVSGLQPCLQKAAHLVEEESILLVELDEMIVTRGRSLHS